MKNELNTNQSYDSDHDDYPEFLTSIKNYFNSVIGAGIPLFTTNAENLFDTFLINLPDEVRQHYTCRACRQFVDRFGGLVSIDENGEIKSAMWNEKDVPKLFVKSIKAMKDIVLKAKANGIFFSDTKILGNPVTGEWSHMSAILPSTMIYRDRLKTVGQKMAEKKEDFRILIAGLLEYPVDAVEQAITLLESESLYRSEKCLGVAKWLYNLHINRSNTQNSKLRDNITWYAVATAPNGFCHIKSSMIGTLLDDIVAELSFESISRRFAEKMSTYMRPQTAPSQGGILQAEKIVEKLGIANSLIRRYATFNEIPYFIWKDNQTIKNEVKAISKTGVFGSVAPKGKNTNTNTNKVDLPKTVMTWDKFQKTILPTAESIEVNIDNPNRLMALVTASDATSENILQWDNPFSWYYHGGIDGEIKRRVEASGGRYENNEIRCSLIWEGHTDLDLHCITPKGFHINYSDKQSRCGGWLDIDMNGGGHRDSSPVENIRWSNNAPSGNYRFYVHNYCQRGKGTVPFKVELEVNGKIYVYNGVAGDTGYQIDVFKFNYVRGQHPEINNSNSHSSSDSWNIPVNSFVRVKGITISPNLWGKEQVIHSGNHTFFLLENCKDLSEGKGRGFFVEMLKPELREIRKTLESYCANTPIEDSDNADACGVGFSKDSEWNLIVKVKNGNSTRMIKIDRWD